MVFGIRGGLGIAATPWFTLCWSNFCPVVIGSTGNVVDVFTYAADITFDGADS